MSAVFDVEELLSARLSVCLSQSGIVSKQLNFFHHLIAAGILVFWH